MELVHTQRGLAQDIKVLAVMKILMDGCPSNYNSACAFSMLCVIRWRCPARESVHPNCVVL